MKQFMYLVSLFIVFNLSCCNAQQLTKDTYSQNFFNKQMQKLSVFPENKKLVGNLLCPVSKLDSILIQNQDYRVCGDIVCPITLANDNTPTLTFYVRTRKDIEGYNEYEAYEKGKRYINNILVFFKLQKDSTYIMTDYIYKPINQGTESFDDFEFVHNPKNRHLILIQKGGNDFGKWWVEFEFEFDKIKKKWMHIKTNLYSASIDIDMKYKREKLIWSRLPQKRLPVEEVEFSEQVSYKDLDLLQM